MDVVLSLVDRSHGERGRGVLEGGADLVEHRGERDGVEARENVHDPPHLVALPVARAAAVLEGVGDLVREVDVVLDQRQEEEEDAGAKPRELERAGQVGDRPLLPQEADGRARPEGRPHAHEAVLDQVLGQLVGLVVGLGRLEPLAARDPRLYRKGELHTDADEEGERHERGLSGGERGAGQVLLPPRRRDEAAADGLLEGEDGHDDQQQDPDDVLPEAVEAALAPRRHVRAIGRQHAQAVPVAAVGRHVVVALRRRINERQPVEHERRQAHRQVRGPVRLGSHQHDLRAAQRLDLEEAQAEDPDWHRRARQREAAHVANNHSPDRRARKPVTHVRLEARLRIAQNVVVLLPRVDVESVVDPLRRKVQRAVHARVHHKLLGDVRHSKEPTLLDEPVAQRGRADALPRRRLVARVVCSLRADAALQLALRHAVHERRGRGWGRRGGETAGGDGRDEVVLRVVRLERLCAGVRVFVGRNERGAVHCREAKIDRRHLGVVLEALAPVVHAVVVAREREREQAVEHRE